MFLDIYLNQLLRQFIVGSYELFVIFNEQEGFERDARRVWQPTGSKQNIH